MTHPGGRQLRNQVRRLLRQPDLAAAIEEILKFPPRRVVSPLIALFFSADEILKWRAVSAAGAVTAALAAEEMESARVVMRRLMWSLNDESGGIGWGSPEAMGDIMARHAGLAREFGAILISYLDPRCNYLEHEILQRGALWGLGRLAHARPALTAPAAGLLPPYLRSPDPALRGLCAWAAGAIACPEARPLLQALAADDSPLTIWMTDRLERRTVGRLAREALSAALPAAPAGGDPAGNGD